MIDYITLFGGIGAGMGMGFMLSEWLFARQQAAHDKARFDADMARFHAEQVKSKAFWDSQKEKSRE